MIVRNRVVQPDAEVCAKNCIQSFFSIHARCRFVTGVRANLKKFFSLNPFQQLVIEHMLVHFVDVVARCVLKSGAGQIDVETQRQR